MFDIGFFVVGVLLPQELVLKFFPLCQVISNLVAISSYFVI